MLFRRKKKQEPLAKPLVPVHNQHNRTTNPPHFINSLGMRVMSRIQHMGHRPATGKSNKENDEDECSHTELSIASDESVLRATPRPISPRHGRRNLFIKSMSVSAISTVPQNVKAGKSWKIEKTTREEKSSSENSKGSSLDLLPKHPVTGRPTLLGDPGSSRRLLHKEQSLRYLSPPSKDFEAFHTEVKKPEEISSKLLGHPNSPRRKFIKQASDRYLQSPRKQYSSLKEAIADFDNVTLDADEDEKGAKSTDSETEKPVDRESQNTSTETKQDVQEKVVETPKKNKKATATSIHYPTSPGAHVEESRSHSSPEARADESDSYPSSLGVPAVESKTKEAKHISSTPQRRTMKKKACARYMSTPRKQFSSLQDAIADYEEVSHHYDDDPEDIKQEDPLKYYPSSPGVFKSADASDNTKTRTKTKRIAFKQSSSRALSSRLLEIADLQGSAEETTENSEGKSVRRIRISKSSVASGAKAEQKEQTTTTPRSKSRGSLFKQLSIRLRSPGMRAPRSPGSNNTPGRSPGRSPGPSKRKLSRNTSLPAMSASILAPPISPGKCQRGVSRQASMPVSPQQSDALKTKVALHLRQIPRKDSFKSPRSAKASFPKSPRKGMFKQNSARYLSTPRRNVASLEDVLDGYDKISIDEEEGSSIIEI